VSGDVICLNTTFLSGSSPIIEVEMQGVHFSEGYDRLGVGLQNLFRRLAWF